MREVPDPLTALIVGIILIIVGVLAAVVSWMVRRGKSEKSGGDGKTPGGHEDEG